MPIRQDDAFTTYKFTPEEIARARELTPEQRAYFQTLHADAAHQKIGILFDPAKPMEFMQTEAYIRGQLDILAMLLSTEQIRRPKNAVTAADNTADKPEVPIIDKQPTKG